MHFADEANITVKAGNGGNGAASFRREKYIPRGGPDGGNGGDGGSIFFEADPNQNTLVNFVSKKHFKAPSGKAGGGKKQAGKKGEDLTLKVPVGTLVYEKGSKVLLADLVELGQRVLVVPGGMGGKGNASFKSSRRQSPDFAELGEPGQEKELHLELKLIADVAIIGYPNAGKSTLISRISNARPKIADYPFTTLMPHLGVVKVGGVDFVVADIPGLIEGAHQGKGLGHEFLRHIERTKILVHLVDIIHENRREEYEKLNEELALFSKVLIRKPQLLVMGKVDATTQETIDVVEDEFIKEDPLFISAVTGFGLNELLYRLKEEILTLRKKERGSKKKAPPNVYRPHEHLPSAENYEVRKEEAGFRVRGQRIEQIAVMTDMSKSGAILRVFDILKKIGAQRDLLHLGAQEGDKVFIGSRTFEFRKAD